MATTGVRSGGSAYEWLRRDIVSAEIAPGAALVETTLAQRYGVSRTPIREALRRLEQDGLVHRGEGRSLRVREHSPEQVLEIYGVRVILEEAAAKDAAMARSELDLTLLTAAHEDMRALDVPDPVAQARSNRLFHQRIRAASRNATLIDLLNRLDEHLHRYPQTTLTYPGRWATVMAEHERLLLAIRDHRSEEAGKIAAAHMTAARDIRLRMYAHGLPQAD
ncbi:MAG: GntR family transcriptional regulator [Sciscionella sp.]